LRRAEKIGPGLHQQIAPADVIPAERAAHVQEYFFDPPESPGFAKAGSALLTQMGNFAPNYRKEHKKLSDSRDRMALVEESRCGKMNPGPPW
jgi:hypothetical protein